MLILRPYQSDAIDKIKKRLKETTHPLLATVSVGGGKSLLISTLLSWASSYGYRCLCLTLNSSLIKQNADTHKSQNGQYGINCSSLDSKASEDLVIFGSPNSICQQIRNKQEISTKPLNLIIVDECHQISQNENSMYLRIFKHYGFLAQQDQRSFRIIGFTGTPFRDKNQSIVGKHAFFKEEVCNITTSFLIDQGYLTKPYFGLTASESFDFKNVKIENTGKFNQKQLQQVVDKNIRLTGEIMLELSQIECNGIFIFCSTIAHCHEALKSLPPDKSAMIIGSTPHHERQEILSKAQTGQIKYLVSVSILMVGVDVPFYDHCAWLRPTESLILFIQGIGRVLRLHETKKRCVVLDYSGNLDRFQDIDHPLINEAIRPKEDEEEDRPIICYSCGTKNSISCRRCIGIVGDSRCEHYFEFKDCPGCQTRNDVTSRHCRECEAELIDPNAKLKRIKAETYTLNVMEAKYNVTPQGYTSIPIINISYRCQDGIDVYEHYYTNTPKSKNITYARFIRLHVEKASDYYMHLSNINKMRELIQGNLKTPVQLVCTKNDGGYYNIVKKVFD